MTFRSNEYDTHSGCTSVIIFCFFFFFDLAYNFQSSVQMLDRKVNVVGRYLAIISYTEHPPLNREKDSDLSNARVLTGSQCCRRGVHCRSQLRAQFPRAFYLIVFVPPNYFNSTPSWILPSRPVLQLQGKRSILTSLVYLPMPDTPMDRSRSIAILQPSPEGMTSPVREYVDNSTILD